MKQLTKALLIKASKNPNTKNRIVSFTEFKRYHKNNPTAHQVMSFEEVIARIETVVIMKNCVKIVFEDNTSIWIYFDGRYKRYNKLGQKQSSRDSDLLIGVDWRTHHIHIYIYGKRILLERLVAVCCDIANGALALYYDDIVANVMDGSGSLETAEYLNISTNFEPSNLEWCTRSENASHGAKIKELKRITEHVYRFSAEDKQLDSLMKSKDFHAVKEYCKNNLFKVR